MILQISTPLKMLLLIVLGAVLGTGNGQELLSKSCDQQRSSFGDNLLSQKFNHLENMISTIGHTIKDISGTGYWTTYNASQPRFPSDCYEYLQLPKALEVLSGIDAYPVVILNELKDLRCSFGLSGYTIFYYEYIYANQDWKVKSWVEYKHGFTMDVGNPQHDYWLGNKFLHHNTVGKSCELRIELINKNNTNRYATYKGFSIGGESEGYPLHIGEFSGDVGFDALRSHNGMKFSTWDRDNDLSPYNCAERMQGAGWYRDCTENGVNLIGDSTETGTGGVWWYGFYPNTSYPTYISRITMMYRCI